MGPFAGLRVIDLSPNRVGAQVSQFFADFGADVIQVEPPGGAVIRSHAAYPFWARGKRSIVLDVHEPVDRDVLSELVRRADVFVETQEPGLLDGLGLGYTDLAETNPRLIYASVTAFGRQGPYVHVPGYEGLVAAKIGAFHAFRRMTKDERPAFITTPFAAFSASQLALHGILAALLERDRSGSGQFVETNLAQAFMTLDTWTWFEYFISERFPGAYTLVSNYDEDGVPRSPVSFMLLVCLTRDGRWLQFACAAPRLFAALMKALGLAWMFTDPDWQGLPAFPDDGAKRSALWERMLDAARQKTLAEWQAVFAADDDVFAEPLRSGAGVLDHPQLIHDHLTIEVVDAERGPVRQPGPLVGATATPADPWRSAPRLDEHSIEICELASAPVVATDEAVAAASEAMPLDGVTILELATMFAAPHAATMLSDLGARIIKVEQLGGDRIRFILPFPELGGAKVMQGKESIAVDLATDEGRAIVAEIAAGVDVVLQGYRAGAMRRAGLDYGAVRAINPDVIYVNAPGYGVDGPYGVKPAYAPSIGAAAGLTLSNLAGTVPERPDLSIEQIKDGVRRLTGSSTMSNAQADGIAALGVTTAILFGLVARARGAGGQELFSSMLNTNVHAMSAQVVTYPGAPREPEPDDQLRGLGALYRIYDAAEGQVFLAAPSDHDFRRLADALAGQADLARDERLSTAGSRDKNSSALLEVLSGVFARRTAQEWEDELLAKGVGCVRVTTDSIESMFFDAGFGEASGYVVNVVHPTFESHPRLAPFLRFSRSSTQALPGVLCGQHTDRILTELGRSAEEIDDLRTRNVVG
jgi:crotonobetainyl-CoA:carnitine CoA-transferase CaiB-like acyl-CoA transferase